MLTEQTAFNNTMGLSVVLPCYNEEENVHRISSELVPELNKLGISYEILLIDDGSTDNTAAFAERLSLPQLRIISHGKNKGLGEAIKTGFKNVKYDLTITLDADFSFRPELIDVLLKRYSLGDVDLVIGSPKLARHHEELTFVRLFISKSALYIYRVLFGKPVTSVNQILRLYKTRDVRNLEIDAKGFDVFAEVLFKLLVLEEKRYAEVPAAMIVRMYGQSKINYYTEMVRHFKLILKIFKWHLKKLFAKKGEEKL